jgi:hypothetical protein
MYKTMFESLRQVVGGFLDYNKNRRSQLELIKESRKLIETAKQVEGLKEFIGRKYYFVRPNGVVEECTMKKVFITLEDDNVTITAEGERGEYYTDRSFYSKEDAIHLGQLVAGTYMKNLEDEKEYLERELDFVTRAIDTAKLPPEEQKKKMQAADKKIVAECDKEECSKKCKEEKCEKKCNKECASEPKKRGRKKKTLVA